jgi:hypothetical protein
MLCNWGKNVIGSSYDAGGIFSGQSCVFRPISCCSVIWDDDCYRIWKVERDNWALSGEADAAIEHLLPPKTESVAYVSKTDTRHSSTELTFLVHACACESILLHQIHFFTSVNSISWTDDNCHKLLSGMPVHIPDHPL